MVKLTADLRVNNQQEVDMVSDSLLLKQLLSLPFTWLSIHKPLVSQTTSVSLQRTK